MSQLSQRPSFKPLKLGGKRGADEENLFRSSAPKTAAGQSAGQIIRSTQAHDVIGARRESSTQPNLAIDVKAFYVLISHYWSLNLLIIFQCVWRAPQQKKHKTWDGDAVLIVNGIKCVLKDREDGKSLGSGTYKNAHTIASGDAFSVGGKDIEIDCPLDIKEVESGACFEQSKPNVADRPRLPPQSVVPTSLPKYKSPSKLENAILAKAKPLDLTKSTSTPKATPRFDPTAKDAVVMPRPDAACEKLFNKKHFEIVDVVLDPAISKRLRPHQLEGVRFMYECVMGLRSEGCGCILADEMGLGKTAQAIGLAWTLLRQTPFYGSGKIVERVLIVCPVSLLKNWDKEFKKWLGVDKARIFIADDKCDIKALCASKAFEIIIVGYERLRIVAEHLQKAQPPVGLIICDEGHRLKGAETKTLAVLKDFSTPRRIVLSGTPIQNDLSELHTIVDWVNPGLLDSYAVFKKYFETPIVRSRGQQCSEKHRQLGDERSQQLARVNKSFMIRRTADILKDYLPPRHDFVVFVLPTLSQKSIYQNLLDRNLLESVLMKSAHLALVKLLINVTTSPLLIKQNGGKIDDGFLARIAPDLHAISGTDIVQSSGKLIALAYMLTTVKSDTSDKVVVVSTSTRTLDLIQQLCQGRSWPLARLDGKTPQKQRQSLVDNFNRTSQDEQYIFLLSSKAGGTGLNLIGANRLVLFDSDWNPSVDLQAMARIHRDGQRKNCYIYRLLTTGTIDEKIYQRQIIKTGLAGSVVDDDAATSGKDSVTFSAEEIRAIFTFESSTDCHTHNLLGCVCDTDPADADSHTEFDDEDLIMDGEFVKASDTSATQLDKAAKNRLNMLRSWSHIACLDGNAAETIADPVLRQAVATRSGRVGQHGASSASQDSGGVLSFIFAKAGGSGLSATL